MEDGDLQQLEDSEDYEFTRDNNRHGATVFNTAKSMAGQLMCMVINEKAHCSQSFILKVKSRLIVSENSQQKLFFSPFFFLFSFLFFLFYKFRKIKKLISVGFFSD